MKEIIENRNIVIFFLIITTTVFTYAKVDQHVCTLSNYAQRTKKYPFFDWKNILGTCSVTDENTQVCSAPTGSNLTGWRDKCQEVVFMPNKCNDLTQIELNDTYNFPHAVLNKRICYFYNSCKNINRLKKEESRAFNQNTQHVLDVKRVAECWNLCRNCSFFSWHTKDLTCHYGELVKQH